MNHENQKTSNIGERIDLLKNKLAKEKLQYIILKMINNFYANLAYNMREKACKTYNVALTRSTWTIDSHLKALDTSKKYIYFRNKYANDNDLISDYKKDLAVLAVIMGSIECGQEIRQKYMELQSKVWHCALRGINYISNTNIEENYHEYVKASRVVDLHTANLEEKIDIIKETQKIIKNKKHLHK